MESRRPRGDLLPLTFTVIYLLVLLAVVAVCALDAWRNGLSMWNVGLTMVGLAGLALLAGQPPAQWPWR